MELSAVEQPRATQRGSRVDTANPLAVKQNEGDAGVAVAVGGAPSKPGAARSSQSVDVFTTVGGSKNRRPSRSSHTDPSLGTSQYPPVSLRPRGEDGDSALNEEAKENIHVRSVPARGICDKCCARSGCLRGLSLPCSSEPSEYSHLTVKMMRDGRRVIGDVDVYVDTLNEERYHCARCIKHVGYEIFGTFGWPCMRLVEGGPVSVVVGTWIFGKCVRDCGSNRCRCNLKDTFAWYLDISVNLSLPLMVISIYLIVTNAPLSDGLPFPMYGFIGKLALLFYGFFTRAIAVGIKYGYVSISDYEKFRRAPFENIGMWMSWLLLQYQDWTPKQIAERIQFVIACNGVVPSPDCPFVFESEFDTLEDAEDASEDISNFLFPTLLPHIRESIDMAISETSRLDDKSGVAHEHDALSAQITVSKVKRNAKNGEPKDKYTVTVPAVLVGTSIAMQEAVGENTLVCLHRSYHFFAIFVVLAPFLLPLISMATPDGRGSFLHMISSPNRMANVERECAYLFDVGDQNTTAIDKRFNAYEVCGYLQVQPKVGSASGVLPLNCSIVQNIAQEFQPAMDYLVENVLWWNDKSGTSRPSNVSLYGWLSDVLSDSGNLHCDVEKSLIGCVPQRYIQKACFAPTPSKREILELVQVLVSLCAYPLILLIGWYGLAGVQSYIRQHNMLRHLDSMITPSIFAERLDSHSEERTGIRRGLGGASQPATLKRRRARNVVGIQSKSQNENISDLPAESKTSSQRMRSARSNHHTQSVLAMNRLPALISFHQSANLRNFFYLRDALRGMYFQINARSAILLRLTILLVVVLVVILVWVIGYGSVCVPALSDCSVIEVYLPIDFVLIVFGFLIQAFILIGAGAYGLYKANLQSSIANRALVYIKNVQFGPEGNKISSSSDYSRESIETMRRLFEYDVSLRPFALLGVPMDATGMGSVQAIGAAVISLLIAIAAHNSTLAGESDE